MAIGMASVVTYCLAKTEIRLKAKKYKKLINW